MKTMSQLFLALVLVMMLAPTESIAQFNKPGQWVGAHFVLTDPVGFGASFEYALEENIGLGGQLRYWSWSKDFFSATFTETVIMPQAVGNYHFQPNEKVDPYVGARLGFAIYSYSYDVDDELMDPINEDEATESSGLFLTFAGGIRYFFTPQWSGRGELEFQIAGTEYFGSAILLQLGVDYTLP